jgi:hypothetical protein
MRIHSFRLFKLMAIVLIAGAAIVSGIQLQTATADLLLCSNTGQPCLYNSDCQHLNPTCYCANVRPGVKVCRGDFEIRARHEIT